jgi:(1->4)-alpha-D-glucan 1-alpha-D-glucosylmutase
VTAPAPRATYRLQFNRDFGFDAARRLVPYLAALGISHVYASPLLMARPGSPHGYDIVDHNRLNPEMGDAAAFEAFVDALHAHGMGLILDFVPNHMGIGADNPWWMDVLEWGRASLYAGYFDIDWEGPEPTLRDKVLLPVLADHYGAVLERGELRLGFEARAGAFTLRSGPVPFPLAPRSVPGLLEKAAHGAGGERLGPLAAAWREALAGGRGAAAVSARRARIAACKAALAQAADTEPGLAGALAQTVAELNGRPGEPRSFDGLHRLLERQHYRLAYWRIAAQEINYRRFFDVNDLAGLRMDTPELFEVSHRLVARLLATGRLQGLRLDHVDGLRDPQAYLERLQRLAAPARGKPGRGGAPLYLLVEKILAAHETLRADWPVAGTTGYEFLNEVNGLFVDPAAAARLTRLWESWAGGAAEIEAMVAEAKRQIMQETLASEMTVLVNAFARLAKRSRRTRDFSRLGLRGALLNVVAEFPVYRTYVSARGVAAADRRDIEWAVGKARRGARTADGALYDFVGAVLTLELPRTDPGFGRQAVLDAALKFQQYTGPVMAKGVEDTVFYRYGRLLSLNEVGATPGRFATSAAALHRANRRRRRDHPGSLLATATHDTKRGEDVRARLNVLSEIPAAWAQRSRRWGEMNRRKRGTVDGRPAPAGADEYFFYQTLVGAWPLDLAAPDFAGIRGYAQRLDGYLRKAVREAKQRTSWAAPHADYEAALAAFVARALDPRQSRPFLEDVSAFVAEIAAAGAVNSLAQLLLKLVSPGVPDIYQGTEGWDFSLVDPDNRRAVAYGARRRTLAAAATATPAALVAGWRDGRIKQIVLQRALALRRREPEVFAAGEYQAVAATGAHAGRVFACARLHGRRAVLAATPRLVWPLLRDRDRPLPEGWGATRLPLAEVFAAGAPLTDVLTGERLAAPSGAGLAVERLWARLPVALLVGERRAGGRRRS